MKKGTTGWTVLFISATLAALSLAVFVYMGQLTKATDASVVASMQELSGHDMKNIQSELENSWDILSAVCARVQASRRGSIQDVCSRLNPEQISNVFRAVYLVDSEGNTYSSTNLIRDDSGKDYVVPLLRGDPAFVMRYDDQFILEALTERLVYGVL